jgi:Flp pilus assembly protein TadD
VRLDVCLLVSVMVAGCGARATGSLELPQPPDGRQSAAAAMAPELVPQATLSEFIAKARAMAAEARPPARPAVTHVETADPKLAAALAMAQVFQSPRTLREVAEEYHRLRIADRALEYLQRAMQLDPRDSATYDALARLWRDGGLFDLALADAHRAVYYAPASPIAHNTLGTVFQAIGRRKEAHEQYARALQLDPSAAYALSNICYGWILDRQPGKAVEACQAALRLSPSLSAARNNLGLAYAVRGDIDATRGAFEGTGDPATALYNLGIVYMAKRQYSDAVTAFAAAQQARPSFRMATARAEQASRLAMAGAD